MILKVWIRIQIADSLLKTNTDEFSTPRRKITGSLGGENMKKPWQNVVLTFVVEIPWETGLHCYMFNYFKTFGSLDGENMNKPWQNVVLTFVAEIPGKLGYCFMFNYFTTLSLLESPPGSPLASIKSLSHCHIKKTN
jgi:hypothetical protein